MQRCGWFDRGPLHVAVLGNSDAEAKSFQTNACGCSCLAAKILYTSLLCIDFDCYSGAASRRNFEHLGNYKSSVTGSSSFYADGDRN